MSSEKDRFDKVLAIAVNPGAYEEEAVAALHKARELVKKDPKLAYPLPRLANPLPQAVPRDEASYQAKITNVSEFWLPILLNNLSEQGYGLGLKTKIICDFAIPTTVDVRCDGTKSACDAFRDHLDLLLDYINSRSGEN